MYDNISSLSDLVSTLRMLTRSERKIIVHIKNILIGRHRFIFQIRQYPNNISGTNLFRDRIVEEVWPVGICLHESELKQLLQTEFKDV